MTDDFLTCQYKGCAVQPGAFRGWYDHWLCEEHYWIVRYWFREFLEVHFK